MDHGGCGFGTIPTEFEIRAKIKVIMLTAAADVNVVRAFNGLGISSYLLKPVSLKQLAERVNAVRTGAL